MTDAIDFLKPIMEKAQTANPEMPGDYYENGLLYCGKCHTPKQTTIEAFQGFPERIVSCRCKCAREEAAREEAAERERMRKMETDNIRRSCFSGPLAEGYMVNKLRGKPLTVAETYLANWDELEADGSGLLIWGDVGTGKTYLAAAIANGIIDKGCTARMLTTSEIILMATDSPEKMAFINDLCRVQLLVIDDLGAERDTAFGQEIIENLINKRYETGRPMLITTNIPLREMQNAVDTTKKRIYDRVLDRCVPVRLDGGSKRREFGADRTRRLRELLAESEAQE